MDQAAAAKLSGSYRVAPESGHGAPKQWPNLLLLFGSQLQIPRKASKLLVDRLWRMDILKLLTRRGLPCPIVLSYGGTCHSEHEHKPTCKRESP
jgi:hypothetical protein